MRFIKRMAMAIRGTVPMPPERRAEFGNAVPVKSRFTITVEKDVHEDVPQKRSLEEVRAGIEKALEQLNTLNERI